MATRIQEALTVISEETVALELMKDSLSAEVKQQAGTIESLKAANAAELAKVQQLESANAELTRQRDHAVDWGKNLAAEFEAHLKTHEPPKPVTPPVMIFLDGVAYAITAESELEPFNRTRVWRIPLLNGLWFWLFDTETHGHARYAVDRQKPGVFGDPLPLIGYTVRIIDPRYSIDHTQVISSPQHGQHQAWSIQNKPWPEAPLDPKLHFTTHPAASAQWIPTVDAGDVDPLEYGELMKATAGTGLRGDIGVYTGWTAEAIRTGNWTEVMLQAEISSSMPWNVRNDDGSPVILMGEDFLNYQMQTYYGTHSAGENTVEENTPWSLDTAHPPAVSYGAYLRNSVDPDPWVVMQLQFRIAALISMAAMTFTRSTSGLLLTREHGRDYAWGMCALADALHATPKVTPSWMIARSKLEVLLEANIVNVHRRLGEVGFTYHGVSVGKKNGATALGAVSTQSNVADYVPIAMLHCYDLLGDPRLLEIGREYLDRRTAQRWRASPRYAGLYPPVSIGTGEGWRFPTSWDEAYQAWEAHVLAKARAAWLKANPGKTAADAEAAIPVGTHRRTSKEGDEDIRWQRPCGNERDVDGDYLMPYNTDAMICHAYCVAQLYKKRGYSTPNIDWLADYLERRRNGAGFTTFEQFAVA